MIRRRFLAAWLGLLAAVLADGPLAAAEAAPETIALQNRRAAWLWEQRIWRFRADDLLDRAEELRLDTLFVALEIRDGKVSHRAALQSFLRGAHARGIAVLAVEGDPHFVSPQGLAHAVERATAIRNYQRSVPARERFDGLQYDIEPYVLPGFDTNNVNHLRRWSDAYATLREAFGEKLDIVLPFWIADKPAGANFVRQAAVHASGLITMAYRTEKSRIIDAARPLLVLGTQLDVPVRVALENGPTDEGPGVSFEGDLAALLNAMRQTKTVLAQRESFAGFAIHGIAFPGQEP